MFLKATLQLGALTLIGLIASSEYLALNHRTESRKLAEMSAESSRVQAEISAVQRDLTDMETGQRGYLLTANDAYLQPYNDAKGRIASDFASLRRALSAAPMREQAMESQLESLANSKQAEMEHSINLRQRGYRHRAFMLVDSNEGMQYMDKARGLLSSLSMAENSNFAKMDAENSAHMHKAFVETIYVNLCLLALTAGLFAGIRYHWQSLEVVAAQSKQELMIRDLQLRKLTSALSTQARAKTSAIEENAFLLLENYGGFLPRQGHEYAEQIKEASAQMEQLRQDLIADPAPAETLEFESVA